MANLCKRWSQLGAFYPFSRNHNSHGAKDQDPGYWIENGHPEVTEATKNALLTRYSLLLYLYTLFYRAHTIGDTVMRPVFHEYPHDSNTFSIDQQFLWGRSLLISPFLYDVRIHFISSAIHINFYFLKYRIRQKLTHTFQMMFGMNQSKADSQSSSRKSEK